MDQRSIIYGSLIGFEAIDQLTYFKAVVKHLILDIQLLIFLKNQSLDPEGKYLVYTDVST